MKSLPPSNCLGNLALTEDDCIALLLCLEIAPLQASRRIAYLKERIVDLLTPLEWQHSQLNKAEDRLLRFWYLTTTPNRPLADDSFSELLARCRRLFGASLFDSETIDAAKVMGFANSTITIHHRAHSHKPKGKVTKDKKPTREELLAQLEEL